MVEKSEPRRRQSLPLMTRLKLLALSFSSSLGIPTPKTSPAAKLVGTTLVSSSDIQIDPSRDLWFRLFTPTSAAAATESLPVIVYFHGGGFSEHSPDSKPFDDLCRHLSAKTPAVVASVNYRLSPRHRYPAPYDDGFDALKFIDDRSHAAVLPPCADLGRCFLMGDSSGGNIAHHVAVRVSQVPREEFGRVKLAGLIGVQPFFGGEERTGSELRLKGGPFIDAERTDVMWRNFLPEGADRNHPAAHVFGGLKDLEDGFPRTLVISGGFDPLEDWDRRYAEGLRSCGGKGVELIEYPNAFHGFYAFPELPEFGLLFDDVAKFIVESS